MMNRRKLEKIRQELLGLAANRSDIKSDVLISIAKRLGREKSKRGKEPTYVRAEDPRLFPPLSIPDHSRPLKRNTAANIVDSLLSDIDTWQVYLSDQLTDEEDEE